MQGGPSAGLKVVRAMDSVLRVLIRVVTTACVVLASADDVLIVLNTIPMIAPSARPPFTHPRFYFFFQS